MIFHNNYWETRHQSHETCLAETQRHTPLSSVNQTVTSRFLEVWAVRNTEQDCWQSQFYKKINAICSSTSLLTHTWASATNRSYIWRGRSGYPPPPQLENSLFLHISSSWQDSWNKEASTIKRIYVMSTWYQQRQLIDLWTPQLFRAVVGLTWLAAKEHGVVKPFLILTKQMVEQRTDFHQNCSKSKFFITFLNDVIFEPFQVFPEVHKTKTLKT